MTTKLNVNAPIFVPSKFKPVKHCISDDESLPPTSSVYSKGVQVDTELEINTGFLIYSNYEEFWTANVRHVGIQTSFVPTARSFYPPQGLETSIVLHQSSRSSVIPSFSNSLPKISENRRPKKPSTTMLSDFVVRNDQKPSCSKTPIPKISTEQKTEMIRGNVLDASEPVYHKGKTRNKVKKPSKLKKIILEERGSADPQNPTDVEKKLKAMSRFVDNSISSDLNKCLNGLLNDLIRFQDRLYAKDPLKVAKIRRRLVKGLQETLKMLKVEKIKLVILTPDIEDVSAEGGLNELIQGILDECRRQNITYVFGLSRWKLGRVVKKFGPVGCVGILNYQGAEQHVSRILEHLAINRILFSDTDRLNNLNVNIPEDPGKTV